jgi:hypothetical protein
VHRNLTPKTFGSSSKPRYIAFPPSLCVSMPFSLYLFNMFLRG